MKVSKMKRPFGLGFGGHARSCDCIHCAAKRAAATVSKWEENGRAAEVDPDKTIFVRSYFRAGPHFTKMPRSRRALAEALRRIARRNRRAA